MAHLVDKVKQKLRSRSSSRSSLSSPVAQTNSRNSTDVPDVPRVPDRNAPHPSSPTSRHDGYPRSSLDNSAFHATRGSSSRASFDSAVARKPLPNSSSNLNPNGSTAPQHRTNHSLGGQQNFREDANPNRDSSRHAAEQDYAQGRNGTRHVEETFPERASSNLPDTSSSASSSPHTVRAVPAEYNASTQADLPTRRATRRISIPERLAPKTPADSELSKPLPQVPAGYNSSNPGNMSRQDAAFPPDSSTNEHMSNSAWMSPMISKGHNRNISSSPPRDNDAAKYEAMASGHLRLPEGFNLQNSEVTHVYETQRPAVTHETIIKQRTEIIREEITRDIHMHHYFTYQQPIKLVEILPPRHFFLNVETGEKTEIEPPFGWSMPPNMFPVSPDTNHLAGWTRHYLVNDHYPYGIPEEAPTLQHESANNHLRDDAMSRTA